MVAHSVTRGWQDIGSLLGLMGATQPPIPCPTEGCLVISVMLSYRHFSKTYPRKPQDTPGLGGGQEGLNQALGGDALFRGIGLRREEPMVGLDEVGGGGNIDVRPRKMAQ